MKSDYCIGIELIIYSKFSYIKTACFKAVFYLIEQSLILS